MGHSQNPTEHTCLIISNRSPTQWQPLNLDVSGWLASLYVRVTRYLDIPWEVVYMAIWLLFISDLYLALLLHNVAL